MPWGHHMLKEAYSSYEKYLRENQLMDLDDLIFHTVKLMKNDTSLQEHYRDRFRYILVDEYQDINYAQYCLIRLLAPDDKSHICVIGDPNQAIYGFRGADVQFIKDFSKDYASARIFTLHKSYRCSNRILKASGRVIHSEEEGISLQGLQQGIKIKIVPEATEKSEAEFIARTIESMMEGVGFFSLDSHVAEEEVAEDNQLKLF